MDQNTQNQPHSSEQASKTETEIVETGVKIPAAGDDSGRGEITASTLARLMGLATINELRLLEGKMDLVVSKITNMTVRLEKISATLSQAPTGSDLERIDVQIGALRTLVRDTMANVAGQALSNKADETAGKKSQIKITSNNPSEPQKSPETKE